MKIALSQSRNIWAVRLLLGLLLAASVYYLFYEDVKLMEWTGVAGITIVAWAGIEAISYFIQDAGKSPLPFWVLFLAAAAVYLDAGGNGLGFYGKYDNYDIIVHSVSGGAVAVLTYFFGLRLVRAGNMQLNVWWLGCWGILTAVFLGVAVEFVEYGLYLVYEEGYWLGSNVDILTDLAADLIGAVAIVAVIWSSERKN